MWIFTLILFIFLASLAYASASGAPWVPTWKKDLERICKLADLRDGETFVELGCGNGRVCRYIAQHSKTPSSFEEGAGGGRVELPRVIGVELSLLQFCVAWIQAKMSRLSARGGSASGGKNIEMKFGNAFHQDLSRVDVVYMFLMPETYQKIRPKLESELKSGSRVVTYVWPIPGWEPSIVDEVEGSQKIYLYRR